MMTGERGEEVFCGEIMVGGDTIDGGAFMTVGEFLSSTDSKSESKTTYFSTLFNLYLCNLRKSGCSRESA